MLEASCDGAPCDLGLRRTQRRSRRIEQSTTLVPWVHPLIFIHECANTTQLPNCITLGTSSHAR
jgi:hypothetical protein